MIYKYKIPPLVRTLCQTGLIIFMILLPSFLFFRHPDEITLRLWIWRLYWQFTNIKTAPFAISSLLCSLLFMYFWFFSSGAKRMIYYFFSLFFAFMVFFGSTCYMFFMYPFREAPVAFKYHVMFGIFWFSGILWIICMEFYSRRKQIFYGIILSLYGFASLTGSIIYFIQSMPLFTPHGGLKGVIIKLGLMSLFLMITGCMMLRISKK